MLSLVIVVTSSAGLKLALAMQPRMKQAKFSIQQLLLSQSSTWSTGLDGLCCWRQPWYQLICCHYFTSWPSSTCHSVLFLVSSPSPQDLVKMETNALQKVSNPHELSTWAYRSYALWSISQHSWHILSTSKSEEWNGAMNNTPSREKTRTEQHEAPKSVWTNNQTNQFWKQIGYQRP